MNEIGIEVIKIYPVNWQKYIKNNFLLMSLFSIILLSLVIYGISAVGFVPQHFLLLILPLALILFTCDTFIYLFLEPLIIYNNGFIRSETKLKIRLFGRSEFINFNEVNNINLMESVSSWKRIMFVLKNKEKILQIINDLNEYKIIIEAFKKYKHSYH